MGRIEASRDPPHMGTLDLSFPPRKLLLRSRIRHCTKEARPKSAAKIAMIATHHLDCCNRLETGSALAR